MTWIQAILLGTVEGLTEFLPISSTGHLMVVAQLLGLDVQSDSFVTSFNIAIQLGAILAVVVLYWRSFLIEWDVLKRVIVAFVPTAIAGLLLYDIVKNQLLTNPALAVWSLGIGGVLLILFELFLG